MINEILEKQRRFFSSGATRDVQFRIQQLQLLSQAIKQHETEILQALKADLHKPAFEGFTSEILMVLEEIEYALKHLKSWVRPQKVAASWTQLPATSYIYPEPLGVVLIIGPWNYPLQLTLSPLVNAIAAGNCAIVKPSEIAPHASQSIAAIISKHFHPGFISVVEGGIETSQSLLAEKFDRIFFTGSAAIGRLVLAAAAQHLTPVTLELGGKSPCLVDLDCDLKLAAKRITWGKFINAGQTCIAPDYLLIPHAIKSELLKHIGEAVREFYGDDPQTSPDYARIVNDKQFARLTTLIDDCKATSEIIFGGTSDPAQRYIAPTVIDRVSPRSKIMADEIFGPLLPVLEYEDLDEAIALINSQPKPLAFYFFSNNRDNQERVLREISFGGGCINDTISHIIYPALPFGGVGNSGMGQYHGKAGFDTFSHYKSVIKKSRFFDLPLRYPPYKDKINLVKQFL
ncbi:aldehyde dehydrogenase [Pseudanabaena sp. PCC 6802]|uniref:aldehyde dehydrogenase n=1 Tax=Pseudanabaena sp. PCC 6802 TaxID=118173 RepID=UPI00036328A4|nr:aldehyde dehydrogenase [Pseudanabaena sp. PCC 6802]